MQYLVLSEAALLLLLVVDSESELDRGRRGSFLYTRKLSVTGWFPPSKPLLGKPGRTGRRDKSGARFGISESPVRASLYQGAGLRCRYRCQRWSYCGGFGVSSSAWLLPAAATEGGRWDSDQCPLHCSQYRGSWGAAQAFWGAQPFSGSSSRRARMSGVPPLELMQTRKHSTLRDRRGSTLKNASKCC